MNIGEAQKDFRLEVDHMGGVFVRPYLEDSRKLQNILSGLVIPLSLVGAVWAALAYLWLLFMVSLLDVSGLLADIPLMLLILLFIGGLTYFWSLFTEGIFVAVRKGGIRSDRRAPGTASPPPHSSSTTGVHHQIASQQTVVRSSQYSGEFDRPISRSS